MTAETDIAFLIIKAGMIVVVERIRIVIAPVGCNVVTLSDFANIDIGHHLAVNSDSDAVADGFNFLGMPLTDWAEIDMLRHSNAIDTPMLLVRMKAGEVIVISLIDGVVMVENLYFHAFVSGINACDIAAGAYADAVVDSRFVEEELKAEYEVAVVLFGIEIAVSAILGSDVNVAVLRHVVRHIAVEIFERAAVEKELEALFSLLGAESTYGRSRELVYIERAQSKPVAAVGNDADLTFGRGCLIGAGDTVYDLIDSNGLAVYIKEKAVVGHLHIYIVPAT